jgi:hypothetical protein
MRKYSTHKGGRKSKINEIITPAFRDNASNLASQQNVNSPTNWNLKQNENFSDTGSSFGMPQGCSGLITINPLNNNEGGTGLNPRLEEVKHPKHNKHRHSKNPSMGGNTPYSILLNVQSPANSINSNLSFYNYLDNKLNLRNSFLRTRQRARKSNIATGIRNALSPNTKSRLPDLVKQKDMNSRQSSANRKPRIFSPKRSFFKPQNQTIDNLQMKKYNSSNEKMSKTQINFKVKSK